MRTVILPTQPRNTNQSSFESGIGAPIFEPGAQTRIRRAQVRAIASVRVVGRDHDIYGQVLDISPGGCLLRTESSIDVGATIEMKITIIGDRRRVIAEVAGTICRDGEHEGRRAYGVTFVAEGASEKKVLQWLYNQALR